MAELKHLDGEQQAVIQEVLATFETLQRNDPKLTDAECVRKFLPFHSSVWSKLRSDSYAGSLDAKISQCRQALRDMEEYLANSHRVTAGKKFHWLTNFQAVLDAITIAKTVANENRLIVFLAPTGGGKSELCRQLAAAKSASIVEARESWRDSYYASCADVCTEIGVRGKATSKREAELKLLGALKTRDHLLALDEGATSFGNHTANMVKLILNQTRTIVLLCGTPELVARMMRTAEGMQLMRRCLATIHGERLTAKEAKAFLPYRVADGGLDLVVRAANEFGMFDLVSRVAEYLGGEHQDGDGVEKSEIETAVRLTRKQLGLE
jgi:type II secretory pathway predicted ATPase ExeA